MKLSDWLTMGFILLVLGVAFAPILPMLAALAGLAVFSVWIDKDS